MGSIEVDQILVDGSVAADVDTTLRPTEKTALLLNALPGAVVEQFSGTRVVRINDQVILSAQVTHLGNPWPGFKKRIQIPNRWVDVYRAAIESGLVPRFVGIYHYRDVTVFVDFEPHAYVQRKANNSAAHVATNDLHQAQTAGVFSRVDSAGNRLTSVRADGFAAYIEGRLADFNPHVEVFDQFNNEFLSRARLDALSAVQEMYAAHWPDTMQGEWAGFYLEYRFQEFLARSKNDRYVSFQKAKRRGDFDYDLAFRVGHEVVFYGDLKASATSSRESPGNDAADLIECVRKYGQFWYVIYEHETWHSKDEDDLPVIEWNEWRRSVGHVGRGEFNPRSYSTRFKSAVRFVGMKILEVNEANFHVVLGDFNQGRQPDGADRAVKVMISKRNIDNFLVYSRSL